MSRPSRIPHLLIALLLVITFSVSARLMTAQIASETDAAPKSLMVSLLGDSRRLFANHFFIKADEYFHAGYYPSIFDQAAVAKKGTGSAVATGAVTGDAHAGEVEWMHAPQDWIERFSRNFFPSEHLHLDGMEDNHDHDGDGKPDHAPEDHDHAHAHDDHGHGHGPAEAPAPGSQMREILPWLRIAAELDPNRIETYVTGAYWLRKRMDRVAEAEAFLRNGLRANPKSPVLAYELARIYDEHHHDTNRAGNLYRIAVRYWNDSERLAPEPDHFMLALILGQYASFERRAGNPTRAVELLRELKKISPHPDSVEQLIQDTLAGKPPAREPR